MTPLKVVYGGLLRVLHDFAALLQIIICHKGSCAAMFHKDTKNKTKKC